VKAGTYVRGDLAILEAGFAALEQAVLVHDKEGRIVACNPAAAKLSGQSVDDILGRGAGGYDQEVRYKDGTPITPENSRLRRCIRTGEPESDVLVEVRDKGGANPRWISVSYQPLIHEGEDEVWGAVSSIVPVPADTAPYETLSDFSRQLQAMLGADEGLLFLKDLDGRYLFMNRRLAEVLGVRRDDATGRTDHELLPAGVADARSESDRRALESRAAVWVEQRLATGDEPRVLHTIKFPLLDGDGEPYAVAGLSADVTGLDRARRDAESQLDGAPVPLLRIAGGRIAYGNRRAHALAELCDELRLAIDAGEPLAELLDDEDVAVKAAVEAGRPIALTRAFERSDGDGEIWLEIEVAPLEQGVAMCSLRDVTRDRERQQELSHQAFHDALTGLPNRRFTEEQLALGLARARRHRGGLGVVFIDIDDFKSVNDNLGHAAGDDLLTDFAGRLSGAVRETDAVGRVADAGSIVARRGGDEFVLVLADLPAECGDIVAMAMRRVQDALEVPFRLDGLELEVAASMGAAVYPYDSQDARTLMELANAAMRVAKRTRRRVRFSEPQDAS
jgi:diguanylate cyclase (GGDEF)-like protein/PAS domain S-box-containing protein